MVLKKSALLWCVLTLSALLWCWWFSWYVCTSTLNLIKLWTKIWKSYGWICLHFNAGPHQTLGFYMEILWLDNCPNKLNFFNIWISTVEVFQQVSLTLERCVPPQDSFCRDLEVHSLSRCSVNFDFWKKHMWHEIFCWTEKFIVMR